QETMSLAAQFTRHLKPGDIIFLEGELGAGKTVFTKGMAKALRVNPQKVTSPTFVLMNYYKGKLPIYHFDLYRLENSEELKTVQLDEYFYGDGISVIEWPQRLGGFAPKQHWLVALKHKSEHQRQICISYPSNPQRKFSL
ncbi:MAG: tRNA (adenosine(37)-N6)-threonylcarbamoyltransferase complex ATPase subunit type 1 TsaE, partial [Candidatus Omnitrophica bacterium]|nr:tRNA (adenosine(37)-N6)-threonylcarbamoyltransferase complex ATPase subunit type 1 TsaE [Candidatus Omnitrophota bacterium]